MIKMCRRLHVCDNWVDWEDVSIGDCNTDGFEHPNYDENGEW